MFYHTFKYTELNLLQYTLHNFLYFSHYTQNNVKYALHYIYRQIDCTLYTEHALYYTPYNTLYSLQYTHRKALHRKKICMLLITQSTIPCMLDTKQFISRYTQKKGIFFTIERTMHCIFTLYTEQCSECLHNIHVHIHYTLNNELYDLHYTLYF